MRKLPQQTRTSCGDLLRRSARGSIEGLLAVTILTVLVGICAAQNNRSDVVDLARQAPTRRAKITVTDDDFPPAAELISANLTRSKQSAGIDTQQKSNGSGKSLNSIHIPGLLPNGTVAEARYLAENLKQNKEILVQPCQDLERKLAAENNELLRRLYSGSAATCGETLSTRKKQVDELEEAIQRAEESDAEQGQTVASK